MAFMVEGNERNSVGREMQKVEIVWEEGTKNCYQPIQMGIKVGQD